MPRRALLWGGIGLAAVVGSGLAVRQLVGGSSGDGPYASDTFEASGEVMSLDIDPTSKTLAVCCPDGVELLDLSTRERQHLLPGNNLLGAKFNADGSGLVMYGERGLALWNSDRGIRDLDTAKSWRDAVFSPDGTSLVTISAAQRHCTHWDIESRRSESLDFCHDAVFSPDSAIIAVGFTGVKLYDAFSFGNGFGEDAYSDLAPESSKDVFALTFNPSGDMIATGGTAGVQLRDAETGEIRKTLTTDYADWVAFTSDGKALAAAGSEPDGKGLRLWNTDTGKKIGALDGRTYTSMALAADGATIATAADSRTVWLWTRD